MGALDVSRYVLPLSFATLCVVGIQISIFSEWRIGGTVIMAVWLWPLCVGLTGNTGLALVSGGLAGLLFDAHTTTPFGLTALVGVAVGYVASRLGREGVGDLDSAALYVTPLIGAIVGMLAPVTFVIAALCLFDTGPWHGGVVQSMTANTIAFFLLARPLTRLAFRVTGTSTRRRR
jgi:cell shape-determining protein MreD